MDTTSAEYPPSPWASALTLEKADNMKTFLDVMQSAQVLDDIKINPLPAGKWECKIKKIDPEAKLRFDFGEVPEGTEYVEIYLDPIRPLDVDGDELEQCPDWSEKLLNISLIGAGDTTKLVDISNERGLVFDTGLDIQDYFTDAGPDFDQLFKDLTGKHVGVHVIHRISKKSGATMTNVKRTFSLDD